MNIYKSAYNRVQTLLKAQKNRKDRKRLINKDFTIITNHCMGGFIYHDLGLQFFSPTINLKILPDDFIELAEHLKYYMEQPMLEAQVEGSPYPVGLLPKLGGAESDCIYIHFVHYKTFEEGKKKWEQRARRINRDNIVIMMTARDGCEYSTLERFEKLPYKQRICYTLKPYPEFPHTKYAAFDNGKPLTGYISDMVNIFGKRAFECNGFDYISFLNKNIE